MVYVSQVTWVREPVKLWNYGGRVILTLTLSPSLPLSRTLPLPLTWTLALTLMTLISIITLAFGCSNGSCGLGLKTNPYLVVQRELSSFECLAISLGPLGGHAHLTPRAPAHGHEGRRGGRCSGYGWS